MTTAYSIKMIDTVLTMSVVVVVQECETDARLRSSCEVAGPSPGVAVHGGRLPEYPQPLASTHDPL